MLRQKKKDIVSQLNTTFHSIDTAFLVDYRGLTVAAITQLRNDLRKFNGSIHIIKNSLARLACSDTAIELLKEEFNGPIAIAYVGENPVDIAKVLLKFADDHPSISLKAAVLQGKKIELKEVEELSKLPSMEVLQAKILGLINAPLQALYTVLQENSRQVLRVIKAKSEQTT